MNTIEEFENAPVGTTATEPDWLDAHTVIATCGSHYGGAYFVWEPADDGIWVCSCGENSHWRELRDVTPLYPKEDA